jgi:hypothetical protein
MRSLLLLKDGQMVVVVRRGRRRRRIWVNGKVRMWRGRRRTLGSSSSNTSSRLRRVQAQRNRGVTAT